MWRNRIALASVGLVALLAVACDVFYPNAMASKDVDGALVILPFYCTEDEAILGLTVVDAETSTVLWRAVAVAQTGSRLRRIRVGDPGPEFREEVPLETRIFAMPPDALLDVRLDMLIRGRERQLDERFMVGRIHSGEAYAWGWRTRSDAEFAELEHDLCTPDQGLVEDLDRRWWVVIGLGFVGFAGLLGVLDARDRRGRAAARRSSQSP
jgi:hypothetical protein